MEAFDLMFDDDDYLLEFEAELQADKAAVPQNNGPSEQLKNQQTNNKKQEDGDII